MLPYISRSKGNQTVTFDQLVEFNIRKIFLKTHTKCDGETIGTPFSKKSKLITSVVQQFKVF